MYIMISDCNHDIEFFRDKFGDYGEVLVCKITPNNTLTQDSYLCLRPYTDKYWVLYCDCLEGYVEFTDKITGEVYKLDNGFLYGIYFNEKE